MARRQHARAPESAQSPRDMSTRSPFVASALAALLVACGGGGEGTKPTPVDNTPIVTSVTVVPGVSQVEIGASATLTAEVRDQKGALMGGKAVAWTSSSPAIVSIDA